jgi:hypothetical protein
LQAPTLKLFTVPSKLDKTGQKFQQWQMFTLCKFTKKFEIFVESGDRDLSLCLEVGACKQETAKI